MYCAYITTLKGLRKHSNADRLQCVEVFGQNVIVDLSYQEGQKVVFFPSDGQLSLEYATDNNLVRKKDENGNNIGGYMDAEKRNVTAIRLRGEKSEGLVLPVETLSKYTDISKLKDGDQITVLGGHEICQKYIPRGKNRSIYISTGWRRGLRNSNIFIDDLCEESFKKEYTCMFNNHTAAFRVAQVGTDKIYIYNAIGIPKENIKYETEFVNRTKETYLNIKGAHKVEGIGFENEIDVHLLIDTNVYDKYEVDFHDGLIFVFLHEIINEKPVLEDVSGEK